jgi:hypothetical protein
MKSLLEYEQEMYSNSNLSSFYPQYNLFTYLSGNLFVRTGQVFLKPTGIEPLA